MNKKLFKTTFGLPLYGLIVLSNLLAANPDTLICETIYEEKFSDIEEGELPEDFFILDGDFEVITKEGNKCLKLSGKPVGEHGFLYGPRISSNSFEVSFSCLGGVKSRRHSVVAGSLGGMRGLTFRSNPVSKKLSFAFAEEMLSEIPVPNWSSNNWIKVRLKVIPVEENFKCEITVSRKDISPELVQKGEIFLKEKEKIRSGRCALWGFAYSEKEMYWDDLLIRVLQ